MRKQTYHAIKIKGMVDCYNLHRQAGYSRERALGVMERLASETCDSQQIAEATARCKGGV